MRVQGAARRGRERGGSVVMTVLIPLTRGYFAAVDDDTAALVSGVKWSYYAALNRTTYAARKIYRDGKRTTVYMHRLIMDAPRSMEVDHIDGDGLNNQRQNLRLATRSQNEQNRHSVRSDSLTGVRGVHRERRSGKYLAYLYVLKRRYRLGLFTTLDEAAKAVAEGRRRYMTHAPENAPGNAA